MISHALGKIAQLSQDLQVSNGGFVSTKERPSRLQFPREELHKFGQGLLRCNKFTKWGQLGSSLVKTKKTGHPKNRVVAK
jgi:hypothetical protein